MNTDAVQKMVLQPLRAKRALALEREEAIRALPNPPSTFGQALFHGQIEYCAGKVAAFDEAIGLVEHRLRVERTTSDDFVEPEDRDEGDPDRHDPARC